MAEHLDCSLVSPSTNKMGCNCLEMQRCLWLAATCYFVLIVSAPSDSAKDATVRQQVNIFQGVPWSEASGGGSGEQTSTSELKRSWTHCSSLVLLCSECKIFTKVVHFNTKRCHWGNSEWAENSKSASFEKSFISELGNFRPVWLEIKCLPYTTALNAPVFSLFSIWQ